MLADNKQINSDVDLDKFFRAFELSTEYRVRKFDGKSMFQDMPQLLKGVIEYQFLDYYFAKVPTWRLWLRRLRAQERIAPNYVVIGPMKNGSSDLVTHLQMHPNVMHPLAKEIKWGNADYIKTYYPTVKEVRRFEQQSQHPVRCGYLKPNLNSINLMEQLYELNPQSKIIITLRDPVSRAYSHWKWEVFLGAQALKNNPHFDSFEKYVDRALDLFPSIPMDTACGFPMLQTGMYYKSVEHWLKRFGRENVMILDTAEYFQNRQPTLEKVQRFLELPVVDIPEYSKKANENPIKLPSANQKTKDKLAAFYKPYNQKLFDLLEKEFDWQ